MVSAGGMRAAAATKSGSTACLFESCLGNWNTSKIFNVMTWSLETLGMLYCSACITNGIFSATGAESMRFLWPQTQQGS